LARIVPTNRVRFGSVPTVSGSGTVNAGVSGSWSSRSNAAGVTMATNFATSGEVTSYIHGDTQAGNLTRDTSEGLSGGAALKLYIPSSTSENPGNWRRGLSNAFTSDGDGFGTTQFYLQYRVKFGPNWLRPSTDGGGRKVMILSGIKFSSPNSSSSALPFEIVHNNQGWRGVVHAYHQDGNSFPPFDETIGGNLRVQPALDWGASYSDQKRYAIWNTGGFTGMSPGCYRWVEGEWYTIYMRVKAATYGGSSGNEMDMYVAGPSDSTYTQLYSARDFTLGDRSDPDYAGGFSGIWFTGFDTGRTAASYNTWFWIGELIASTQPIACPTPLVTIPSWASGQTDKTWLQPVSNTINSVWQNTTAGAGSSSHMAYSGAWDFDHATKTLVTGYGGGHGDGDSNQVPVLALAASSPAWALQKNPSTSQTRSGTDYTCVYSDGQPRSSHTFKHGVWVPGTQSYWITSQAGLYNDGQNGGRFFELSRNSSSFAARGYVTGADATNGVGDTMTNGVSGFDPYTGQIWTLTAEGPAWSLDPLTYAVSVKSNTNPLNFTFSAALAPEHRCFLIYRSATPAVRTYDIDSDTYYTPTISGSGPTGNSAVGLVWHAPSDAFLAWGHSSGRTTLYKLSPPSTFSFTGTWTWSTVTADASNGITPPDIGTYGDAKDLIHGKFALCKNFASSRSDLLALTLRSDGPVSVYRLPKGGV